MTHSSSGVRTSELSWGEFLDRVLPEARELVGDGSETGIEAYLSVLASLACRVDPASVKGPGRFSSYPGYPPDVGFALTHRGAPFIGVQFRIEPGASLPFHPHAGGSVCTLFLEGSARVRNFEFVEAPDWDAKGDVLLRETREELLLPGRINLVGNPRDNIHGFVAGPEGARGIDLTTVHSGLPKRPDSLFEIADGALDPELGIYEAVWRDK